MHNYSGSTFVLVLYPTLAMYTKRIWLLLLLIMFLHSCAYVYQVQVGDIDDRESFEPTPFVIRVSETGVNLEEVGDIAQALGSDSGKEGAEFLKMIQIGPTTGNPVYNERYAEDLLLLIKQKCPDGRVSGLTSIREQKKYPVISGEIVKITGNCLRKRSS